MKPEFQIVEKFLLHCDYIMAEQIVPLYDQEAIAGIVMQTVDDYVPLQEIKIPDVPKCDGAVHVRGNSMYPLLHSGDIVMYKITGNRRANLFFGKMYLVVFDLDGDVYVTIKFLHRSEREGYYRLESFNPEFAPKEIPIDSVRSLALIKCSVRYDSIG